MTEPKIRDILVGLYTKQESKFFNEHYTFTIATRKEVTKSKPKFYLLFKERKERKEKKERNGRETPGIVFPYRRPLVGAPSDVVV